MPETPPAHPFLLWFPDLTPALVRANAPEETFFLDPGIASEPAPPLWQPPTLPLDADTARIFLRESARFAGEQARGRQSLAASALSRDDFYAQTSLAIRSQLTAAAQADPARPIQAIQAQQTLLLAWQVEQQALEIQALQRSIRTGWDDLAQTLGVDESDAMPPLAGEMDFPEDAAQLLSWQTILEALLCFAPPQALLTTSRKDILAALAELESCDPATCPEQLPQPAQALLAAGAARLARAPGWSLSGRTRPPADRPWLAAPRTVLLLAAPPKKDREMIAP
jgi:hypothetical protein